MASLQWELLFNEHWSLLLVLMHGSLIKEAFAEFHTAELIQMSPSTVLFWDHSAALAGNFSCCCYCCCWRITVYTQFTYREQVCIAVRSVSVCVCVCVCVRVYEFGIQFLLMVDFKRRCAACF